MIFLCLIAARWQWHRGEFRSHQNSIIASNVEKPPIDSGEKIGIDPVKDQWRTITLNGRFEPTHQLLLRNRYSNDGQFGFEVLTLFDSKQIGQVWVDRGWVAAGANAQTPPTIKKVSQIESTIKVRIRSDDISRQIDGSFFALPGSSKKTIDLRTVQGVQASAYYVDLLSGDSPATEPLSQISLPDLSNGPHFAYAIQWLAFALLILIGRILLFRESQRLPLVKIKVESSKSN